MLVTSSRLGGSDTRPRQRPVKAYQDEETAIQPPVGGTKIAWGGPPVEVVDGRSRHPLVLAASGDGGLAAEVKRLISLGACRIETEAEGTVVLQDPDGNEFLVQGETEAPHATSGLGDA